MSTSVAFGRVVRRARKKLGFSQEELADRCSLHRNAIGLVERGERSPSFDTLLAIAHGLDVKPSTLVARVEREMNK